MMANRAPLIFLSLIMLTGFVLGIAQGCSRAVTPLLGLAAGPAYGYIVSTFLLQALLPKAGVNLPQLTWLFGGTQRAASSASVDTDRSVVGGTDEQKSLLALTSLAIRVSSPYIIAIAIALFIVLATRLGNRSVKKG